jgi:UDP-N-acetylmuramate dehydrogenase
MSFEDISNDIAQKVPELRGRLRANESLAPVTWFRVGGPAQLYFGPADERDLAYFLENIPRELPVTVIGLGSNLIVRDGGIPGVVIRLGRGFGQIEALEDRQLRVGAIVPDVRLAMKAADEGIAGLGFYRGIPGSVGGALRMNAGAHGGETRDILVEARAVDRNGKLHILKNADMGYSYRHCSVPDDFIFTQALYAGERGDADELHRLMRDVVEYREEKQPVKSRTGGSTFKNPEGYSAWKLVDAAGCRGLRVGGAHVSSKHCNFLINDEEATAADIEKLGETVRKRGFENSGIKLHWEIRRIGVSLDGNEHPPVAG